MKDILALVVTALVVGGIPAGFGRVVIECKRAQCHVVTLEDRTHELRCRYFRCRSRTPLGGVLR